MSVIIRLQNLPWSANALDIRAFFRGLSIPDGGVHIVGGEMGDAFIAFSTDEDARQAMMLDRGKVNEVQVRLLLSSRAEMQKVIEQARQHSLAMMQIASKQPQVVQQQSPKPLPTPQPPIITSTSLQNILSQQKVAFNENSTQSCQSIVQSHSDNSMDSRDSRDHMKYNDRDRDRDYSKSRDKDRKGRNNSRSRSRSRSRDRRRSRSRERDRGSNRRRGYRSRTRSPERRNRRRRSKERSRDRDRQDNKNARDRSHSRSRSRSRSRSYERVRGRDYNRGTNDKKFNAGKENKNETVKSIKTIEPAKTEPTPKPNPWASITPLSLQTPVFATNYGQNFGACQVQPQPQQQPQQQQQQQQQNPSMLSSFPSFCSNSLPSLQHLQQTQPQLTQQLTQQNTNQMLQNQLQSTAVLQSFLGASLNSPFNYGMLNTTNSTNVKTTEPTNTKVFQNSYLDQKLSSVNENPLNRVTNFSGIFSNKNTTSDNKFEQNKDYKNFHRNINTNSPSTENSRKDYNKFESRFQNKDRKSTGNCVKISNMCPGTTYSDIRRFFSGLYIANNGIKMINDKHGYRIGTAYIRFVREDSKHRAVLRSNSMLKTRNVAIEAVTEKEFDEAVDSFKPNKYNRYQDNQNDGKTRESDRNDRRPSEHTEFSTLLLEDIPAFATEQDVMKMFSLYTVIDIILTQPSGKKQYIAYVKFHRAEDAKKALSDKLKHAIGHKQIFVSPCSDEEFDKAKGEHNVIDEEEEEEQEEPPNEIEYKDAENSQDMDIGDSNENKLEDDNVNTQIKQTENIIEERKIDDNLEDTKEENDTNKLSNNQDQEESHEESNEVIQESQVDFNETPKIPSLLSLNPIIPNDPRQRIRGWDNNSGRNNRYENVGNSIYVHLKNCEYKASKLDILHFFGKINLTPCHIEFLKNNRGQQNGEVIVEFLNPQDAKKSLDNHNAMCNNRRIKIELVSNNFVIDKLGEEFLQERRDKTENQNVNNSNNNLNSNSQKSTYDFKNNELNVGNRVNNDDSNSSIKKENINRQKTSRFSDVNENSNNSSYSNRGRFNSGDNKGTNNTDSNMNNNQNNNRKDSNNGGSGYNFNNRSRVSGAISGASVNQFGKPGCVVSLENVPYKAGIEDILEFFRRFNIQPHNVIRRYNDDGTPTGDARVAFTSPTEAQLAIKHKNKQKIFNRIIFLSVVQK